MRGDEPRQWLVITVRCAQEAADAVRERLIEMTGGRGTSEESVEDTVLLRAYAPVGDDWATAVAELADQLAAMRPLFGDGMVGAPVAQFVSEEDWAESWKRHYRPTVVGRVVIKPSWLAMPPEAPPEGVLVELDPQMAFGTGTHATTRLMLGACQDVLRPGDIVADVGTGSGILAIAAAKLGAGRVYATDNDPVAVRAARDNAERNGVAGTVEIREGEYLDAVPGGLDGILANISPAAVVELAPAALAHLKSDGYLVASGFTARAEGEVREALEAIGFVGFEQRAEEEWRCAIARRP